MQLQVNACLLIRILSIPQEKKVYILFQFQWCIKICNYIHVVGSTCIQRNEKKELYSAIKHLMHIEIKTFQK